MIRVFKLLILQFFIFSASIGAGLPLRDEGILVPMINMVNEPILPRNFRIPAAFSQQSNNTDLFQDLENLNASGSSQFSKEGLKKIVCALNTPNITIIDLREECHGFINGTAISWKSTHNWANIGKSLEAILLDENAYLSKAYSDGSILLSYDSKSEHAIIEIGQVKIERVETEKEIVLAQGLNYIRLPVTDHCRPTDIVIDQFINLINTLHSDDWLHFHCAAGKGRTTMFIAMLDMMQNGTKHSLYDILLRQHLIGGSDLLAPSSMSWKKDYIEQRKEFLSHFYQYCLDGFHLGETWSTWLSKHPLHSKTS